MDRILHPPEGHLQAAAQVSRSCSKRGRREARCSLQRTATEGVNPSPDHWWRSFTVRLRLQHDRADLRGSSALPPQKLCTASLSCFSQGDLNGQGVVHSVHCMVSPGVPPGSSGTARTHVSLCPKMSLTRSCWCRLYQPANDTGCAWHDRNSAHFQQPESHDHSSRSFWISASGRGHPGWRSRYFQHLATGWHSGCPCCSSQLGAAVPSGTETSLQQQQQLTSSCGREGFG